MGNLELAESRGLAAIGRWARVSLAVAALCTSVACGWGEKIEPPADSPGLDETAAPNIPANIPTNTPTEPSTEPAEPPAVAAYAVRWHPSTSAGVKAYELTIAPRSGGSDRIVTIPVAVARSGSNNTLFYEISLETDRDHVLSLRAYDGSISSPPSNEIIVRASALIASAAAIMAGPSAATAFVAETGSGDSSSSDDTATASTDGGVSGDDGSSTGSATSSIGSSDALASLEFDGLGSHLEGNFAPEFDLAAGSTFAAWLRPALDDDAVRRVVFSAGAGQGAGFDALELVIVDGGSVELVVRDSSGGVGLRSMFAAGLEHDAWQHLALVFDAEADRPFTLYLDGARVTDDGSTPGDFARAAAAGTLRIGAGTEGEGYAGRIGHVAVWSRALEGAELVTLNELGHDADLRIEAEGDSLSHYWRLGEGEAATEADLAAGSDAPIDLAPVLAPAAADLVAVRDAPQPLE